MTFNIIFKTARQMVVEVLNKDIYNTSEYEIYLNDEFHMTSNKVIQTINDLYPNTTYTIYIKTGRSISEVATFVTDIEFVTLDVKEFGAKGDGHNNDTVFIQAAISSCPKGGRVFIPKGEYKVTSLFLKSDITLEIGKDAVISAITEREQFPVLPGLIESNNERDEYNLGTWEGNPLDMFAGILTGIQVSNVIICGQGTIDGNANYENWWMDAKVRRIAFRPRLIFLNHCSNVTVQGITVKNSPSWNIHPYFSDHLKFIDLTILNPKDSPNTDGLNPESCKYVEIIGIYFSLGDDCIAIKSGKIYMGSKYKVACESILIRQCYMRDGHGSITIGSEMSGGIKNVVVRDCKFYHTDRGFRIKTRRGRGKEGIVDNIVFDNIIMDQVLTPIVINSFYFCDPDGHSEYVKKKARLPIDDRTPIIGSLIFKNMKCTNCHVAATFIYGLPEKKIKKISMKNINISYSENSKLGFPAMMDDLNEMNYNGIHVNNIELLEMEDVTIVGYEGRGLVISNVDQLILDEVSKKLL